MEETGKAIISVADHPIHSCLAAFSGRYALVVLSTPRSVARALDRMAWYYMQRRGEEKLARG